MREGPRIRPEVSLQRIEMRLVVDDSTSRRFQKRCRVASDGVLVGYCWIYAVDARASIAGGGASSCAASRPFSKYNTRDVSLGRL